MIILRQKEYGLAGRTALGLALAPVGAIGGTIAGVKYASKHKLGLKEEKIDPKEAKKLKEILERNRELEKRIGKMSNPEFNKLVKNASKGYPNELDESGALDDFFYGDDEGYQGATKEKVLKNLKKNNALSEEHIKKVESGKATRTIDSSGKAIGKGMAIGTGIALAAPHIIHGIKKLARK